MKKNIVIIGAGISGLASAYRLSKYEESTGAGLDIVIVEKGNRIGGTILTERTNEFVIEGGPDCFYTEKPDALKLVKELGISDRLIGTNNNNQGTFVLWKDRLHKLPEGVILMIPTRFTSFATSSLFSLKGKFRMGMELFVPGRKDGIDESLSEFTIRRFGKEALDRLAEPLVAGIHAGEPDTMSVRSSFPRFIEMEKRYRSLILGMLKARKMMKKHSRSESISMFMTMRTGLKEIIDKLYEQMKGVTIQTGVYAQAIETDNHGNYGVTLSDGKTMQADAVIIAAPAYAAGLLLRNLHKELSELLISIPYVSTATVSLAYSRDDFNHPLNGFGFVVPRKEKRNIMAGTWTSSKFSYRAPANTVLIRCFVGGAGNDGIVFKPDHELLKLIQTDLKDIMGIEAKPLLTRIYRWDKAMPQYTIGHEEKVKSIEQYTSNLKRIYLSGSAYHGIGISDCIKSGYKASEDAFKDLF